MTKITLEIKSNQLGVKKTARYYSAGGEAGPVRHLWIVLHGYSQLAASFIDQFDVLSRDGSMIVAPEGLSRFYIKGYFGKVGATWMTREDREHDILDNMKYLDAMLDDVFQRLDGTPERVTVLGYSQGGSTAARWASVTTQAIHNLVLWCSDFPRDISGPSLAVLRQLNFWYVHSSHDEFMDDDLFVKQTEYLDEKKVGYQKLFFEGKHEIREDVLRRLQNAVNG